MEVPEGLCFNCQVNALFVNNKKTYLLFIIFFFIFFFVKDFVQFLVVIIVI